MRKFLIIIIALLASVACSKVVMDPLRLQIPGTYWSAATETQGARITFPDNNHVSVIQVNYSTGASQAEHGTYTLDGHRVQLSGTNWSDNILLVRTFTHLKNSKTNKNMDPMFPVSYDSVAGSVWTTMVNDNFHMAFFDHDGTCVNTTFINANHKEGFDYGWEFGRKDYSLDGSKLEVGSIKATLFEDFMVVDTLAVLITAPAPGVTGGQSPLSGTVWTLQTTGYPGLIVFTSDSTFTRILTGSRINYVFCNGTYQLNGTTLTLTYGDVKEAPCEISDGKFTVFEEKVYERTYAKATLP